MLIIFFKQLLIDTFEKHKIIHIFFDLYEEEIKKV